jgi:addiction module HigA family antidote
MSDKIPNIHPGEILYNDFLIPLNISAFFLAKETHMGHTRINQIIKGKRKITIDTALRFAKFFGTTPEFWLNLQQHYDLEEIKNEMKTEIKKIKPLERIDK